MAWASMRYESGIVKNGNMTEPSLGDWDSEKLVNSG
jgi:hypothetical protein